MGDKSRCHKPRNTFNGGYKTTGLGHSLNVYFECLNGCSIDNVVLIDIWLVCFMVLQGCLLRCIFGSHSFPLFSVIWQIVYTAVT